MNDIKDFVTGASKDIAEMMNRFAMKMMDYCENQIYTAYTTECKNMWPIKSLNGEEIKDPVSGEPFSSKDPETLANQLRRSVGRPIDSEDPNTWSRTMRLWVDIKGLPNGDKIERAGRMLEVYGCRPWGKLKSDLGTPTGLKKAIGE